MRKKLYETPTLLFVRAKFDYRSDDPSMLRFLRGDIIEVLTVLKSGWWDGLLGEERGWIPSNYVEIISKAEAKAALGVLWPGDWQNEWDGSDGQSVEDESKTWGAKNQILAVDEGPRTRNIAPVSSRTDRLSDISTEYLTPSRCLQDQTNKKQSSKATQRIVTRATSMPGPSTAAQVTISKNMVSIDFFHWRVI